MTRASSAGRVQRRRDKLRADGLRPLQIWVPDTRAPGFADELARQAQVIARHTSENELRWLDDALDELLEDLAADEY